MIEQDNFEMTKLKYMINMLNSMKNKDKTFENASKEVGEKFAEEYIKPLVDKLDKAKKEEEEEEEEDNKLEEVD